MEKINLSEKLDFTNTDLTAPYTVIEGLVSQIKEQTNNIITGAVETYDGPVISYKIPSVLSNLQTMLYLDNKEIDVQEKLGKDGDKTNKYEFYLSTPAFEQYKYRIGFIQYGISNYPAIVVLEQSVADEINKGVNNSSYIYKCNNPTELEELIIKVIYSKTVINVMQELIHINQIYSNNKIIG